MHSNWRQIQVIGDDGSCTHIYTVDETGRMVTRIPRQKRRMLQLGCPMDALDTVHRAVLPIPVFTGGGSKEQADQPLACKEENEVRDENALRSCNEEKGDVSQYASASDHEYFRVEDDIEMFGEEGDCDSLDWTLSY